MQLATQSLMQYSTPCQSAPGYSCFAACSDKIAQRRAGGHTLSSSGVCPVLLQVLLLDGPAKGAELQYDYEDICKLAKQ